MRGQLSVLLRASRDVGRATRWSKPLSAVYANSCVLSPTLTAWRACALWKVASQRSTSVLYRI